MGKGKNWDKYENAALARAWIAASNDPICGTYQKGKTFNATLVKYFVARAPQPPVPGRFGFRSPESIRQHCSDISADCQKFKVALRYIENCSPTGVTQDQIIGMAISKHLGEASVLDYNTKDQDHDAWVNARAWKVFSTEPKWNLSITQKSTLSSTPASSSQPADLYSIPSPSDGVEAEDGSPDSNVVVGDDVHQEDSAVAASMPSSSGKRRGSGMPGRDVAKAVRREEIATQAVSRMAKALVKKTEIMEERNNILLFSAGDELLDSEEDRQMKREFLRMSRAASLKKIKERVSDSGSVSNDAQSVAVSPTAPPAPPPQTASQGHCEELS